MTRIALTSRTLNRIITPLLWRKVSLTRPRVWSFASPPGPRKSRHLVHRACSCARAIKKNPSLAAFVLSFSLGGWFIKDTGSESPDFEVVQELNHAFDQIISALLRCTNLTTLFLEEIRIPPRLHHALYHLPSLRSLSLSSCVLSCRGETCAMDPSRLPITHIKLVQTTYSVHGYNHFINSVESLAQAANLVTLEIDSAIFDQVMDMYITRGGLPQTLTTLRATVPWGVDDESSALLTSFLGLPNNPLRDISLTDGGKENWQALPEEALPNLRNVSGPTKFVKRMVEGRSGIEGVSFRQCIVSPEMLRDYLEGVMKTSRDTLKRLAFETSVLSGPLMEVLVKYLPHLEEITIEYHTIPNGFWVGRGLPFLRRLPALTQVTLVNHYPDIMGLLHSEELPEEMLEDRIPLAWEAVCPNLRRITLTDRWAWRRIAARLWARETLVDVDWKEHAFRF